MKLVRVPLGARHNQPATLAKSPVVRKNSFLVEQSNALIDANSKILTHASQYPNVRGEDVRSIFLSTFINVSKGGNRNAA